MQNILLVGAGTMGSVHAQAYAEMDNVNLVGIVDQDITRCQEMAEMYGTKAYDSFEKAMKELSDLLDVVDICVPTHLHKQYVLAVADYGKHVICEKPIARNAQEAREMIDYCKEKQVKLFVGHVVRFFHEYVRAKELIDAGKIGKVAVARMMRGGIFPTAWNDWYTDYNKSGGLMLDLVIHDFDFLRWCFGEVERVYAKSLLGRNYLRLEYGLVTLRFKSGVIAHLEGTWAHDGFSSRYEIAGEKGMIDYDSTAASPITSFERNTNQKGAGGVAVPESPLKHDPYFLELQHFIKCIELDEEPLITPEDAYKAVEIACAALESVETGKPVFL